MNKQQNNWIKIGYNKGYQNAIEEFEKMMDNIDLRLMFTDIKDKKKKKIELSDEFMGLINIWWKQTYEHINKQLQELKVKE